MKIKKHYSVIHSDLVLKLIKKRLSKGKGEIEVDQWSNGREQGYSLFVSTPSSLKCARINFAQQRNSDNMVVMCGDLINFDITTHQPNNDLWNKQHHYSNDEVCAQYIVDRIREYVGASSSVG